jgi:septum formation protein
MSVPPLLLASTSTQRRAILEQLRIPFDVVAPRYTEDGDDPVAHAIGKAVSVVGQAGERPVLGVDTTVDCEGLTFGKPADAGEAARMLGALAGRRHEVVSGLCLIADGRELSGREVTRVSFRALSASEVDAYVEAGEWRGRAGGYAIQGLGASLVESIEGDYLNVVGLPAALLVRMLSECFPGRYGFGRT